MDILNVTTEAAKSNPDKRPTRVPTDKIELIRSLTERLPVMITPKWVRVKAQPISIRDVLAYLVAAINKPFKQSEVFEIGGEDQVSYSEIMKEYARQRELKRAILPVPFLSLRLSSLWMSFVTPIYAAVGMKLIESVKHATVVNDLEKTQHAFSIRTMNMSEAIRVAIKAEQQEFLKELCRLAWLWSPSYGSHHHHLFLI